MAELANGEDVYGTQVVCFRAVWDANLNLNSTSKKNRYHETF